jgi:cytochrome P450
VKLRYPPGPPNKLPIIGHALKVQKDPGEFLYNCYRQYGPVFRITFIGRKCAVFVGPEANKYLLSTGVSHFHWGPVLHFFEKYLGKEFFSLYDGEEHAKRRRQYHPAFSHSALENYAEGMCRISQEKISQWGQGHPGRIDLFQQTKRLTMEGIARLLVGLKLEERQYDLFTQLFTDILTPLETPLGLLPIPFAGPHARAIRARKLLWPMAREIVQEKRRNPQRDALSLLAAFRDENGAELSEDRLISDTLGFFFAGMHTSSFVLGMTLLMLHENPVILERVMAEIDEVFGDQPVTLHKIHSLKYLSQVLMEVGRMFPPLAFNIRSVVEPCEFGGYEIPKDWLAAYSPAASHRIPEYFQNPYQFNPDRFASPRSEHKQSGFALVTFGGGPRVCLGMNYAQMEAAIHIVTALRKWEFTFSPNYLKLLSWAPTTHFKEPVWVNIRPRRR